MGVPEARKPFGRTALRLLRAETKERRLDGHQLLEIIADNLSKAGWSWGCVSAIDSNGRTIFVADAHRGGS
jgi:hypothetical protein